jgi:EAL domain-containing protein (putative c-di-GMP-specific phosphodiesterase class I)
VDRVAATLEATGVEPRLLYLEIVESLAMEDAERTTEIILALKRLGVRFAIDDFGTGYSSLNYLKRFPVDEVKIDRSFVSGLAADGVDAIIVQSVTNLLQALGMTAVAEGVETEAQLEHLRQIGCPAAQGFLFSPPVPAAEFRALAAAQCVPAAASRRGRGSGRGRPAGATRPQGPARAVPA